MTTLWKINCMEDRDPGMWHQWYRNQCVAVGWSAKWGFTLDGPAKRGAGWPGWRRVRKNLKRIEKGDLIVVALGGHRIGALGEVTDTAFGDEQWNPLVPPTKSAPDGEKGRRIHVRWDMVTGPDTRDRVVLLPAHARFTSGELRPTLAIIRSISLPNLLRAMNDPANWVGLLSHFSYERALSDFIAAYPHRLEDGLVLHPSEKIRERVLDDKSRLDILLLDRNDRPVIVECKQYAPTIGNLKQLRNYMNRLQRETDVEPRGILVHGGAAKLHADIVKDASLKPRVEIVRYELDVEFTSCS